MPSDSSHISIQNSPPVAVLAYCMSSIMMTVTNKYVLSVGHFNFNCILLAVQSFVCLIVILGLKSAGIVNFRNFNSGEAKKWFPISVLLVAMIYTASKAMQYLSIPVYTIFKNVTIILIAYGEVLWFGGNVTPMALLSFLLIVLSSVVASWADITSAAPGSESAAYGIFNLGYFWMFANCLSNAGFVLFLRKRIKLTNFTDLDTMFYNNLLSIPVLLVGSIIFEDWSAENVALNFPPATRNVVFSMMILSGLFSLGISYTSGWCVRVTSSTTYSMVGALNKLPVALSGLIFFDTPVTFANCSAIFLGFLAGIVYAVAKVQQQKQKDNILPTSNKA
ncbi:Vrg4p [Sugiyamaella lignohabitans]|uniref:GDP-mannose transporter n=1 Tax=Sugiyamaella lignohabitans TaxID=796027 RepID=A0A167EK24_9ASCO|nr:Vrg4p [Sugiyamaella lignohabitans]ANB14168.1 Vrg4p [Sugiyamaella lignohabitans]